VAETIYNFDYISDGEAFLVVARATVPKPRQPTGRLRGPDSLNIGANLTMFPAIAPYPVSGVMSNFA